MAKVSPDPILIVGSGALGCLFAARLAQAGYAVNLLGSWVEGIDALNLEGVTLLEADRRQSWPLRASHEPGDFTGAKLALVLVKAWQTSRAAAQLRECLAPDGLALTLQNGLGNRETLAAALGEERVAYGVITVGATLVGPGQVRWGGEGYISLTAHEDLAQLLRQAGFQVDLAENVTGLAWSKLVINAAINPLSALLNVPNGELLARPSARQLCRQLAQEVAAVAAAQGIALTHSDPAAAAEEVAQRTAGNLSSMLQDVRRGAPTEIDAICGAVVRAARGVGLSAPVNETMWKLVSALQGAT
ncbi:MAG: 2-dehydropantoate 2-reductase [Anaerolineales bacterium]|nr:2-dehydropantoate 2-reductase [Anaerolineales bacterium]MCW5855347.1 2-dehydropantoate 2-reductase [Anaerolineales bacterium]